MTRPDDDPLAPVRYLSQRSTSQDVNPLVRRWLGMLALIVLAVLVVVILELVGLRQLRADTLHNREQGRGNRVVSCTTVALVDPAVAAKLPQCAGIDLP